MQLILLSYPGVVGEVLLSAYVGYVSCTSFDMKTNDGGGDIGSMSFGDEGSPKANGGNDKPPKRLGIDSLTIHRTADKATPKFLGLAFQKREDGDVATIIVCRANESGDALASGSQQTWASPFLTITLTDVHISSHSLTVSGDSLDEEISISFKQLDVAYTVFKNGNNTGNVTCHVDLSGEK